MERMSLKEKLIRYYYLYKWRMYIYIMDKHNSLEYYIPSILDPMPKVKRGEDTQQYTDRIPAKYAVRYTRYNFYKWRKLGAYIRLDGVPREYNKKSTKFLKKFADSVLTYESFLEDEFRKALRRKFEEKPQKKD